MKTKLLILAVAVLALASCSNDEVVQTAATSDANTISFRPLMTGVTRAAAKSAFADNDVIDVWAVYNSAKYFQDDYTYNSTTGFTSTEPHYWPSDVSTKNVTFNAVYGSTTNDGTRTKLTTRCRVAHAPHTAAASQTDMLVAQHTSSTKETTVTLNFRHALSQIVVQAKNTNPNLKVSIRGVRVGFVAQEGYLLYEGDTDLRQAETDGSITGGVTLISTIQWHNDSPSNANANKYDQTGLTATELVGNASDAAHTITGFSNWMLLPQTMREHTTESSNMVYTTQENGSATGDPKLTGSYLALYMKVENYYNSAVNGEIVAYQWCYWPITTNWLAGKKYTYIIDAAQGGYQPTNVDTTESTDLDEILGGLEIRFSPSTTIEAWVTEANIDVTM